MSEVQRIRTRQAWLGGGEKLVGPVVFEIHNGLIEDVKSGREAQATVVDVDSELTAIPGLIDSHEHLGVDIGDERAQAFESDGRSLLRGARNLRTMTQGGVTTIRCCGDRQDLEQYWIEALRDKILAGPRVVRSVAPICRSGGHAWYLSTQADGVDEVVKAVRSHVRAGAHFIKVMVTGGMGTLGSDPRSPEFLPEELTSLISESHRLGRRVGGHAHGGPGVDVAIEAGIDAFEHGCLLSRKQIEKMANQGTWLVATIGVGLAFETDPAVPGEIRAKAAEGHAEYFDILRAAREHGVRIATGTDCVHGRVDREVFLLVDKCGFSPLAALKAATCNGAELIGDDSIGVLEKGKRADIVLVDGDPLADPSALEDVRWVLQAGEWLVRNQPR